MGHRLDNWLSKAANNTQTRRLWKQRFEKFSSWVEKTKQLNCMADEVDDVIRKDFETMPSHIFQDKYKDVLMKYLASLSNLNQNSALAYISGVRSFFTNEAASINLIKSRMPKTQMAMNEHRFSLQELHAMWLVADTEGKARLSTAVSLGWAAGDFIGLETSYIKKLLNNIDADGFSSFDYIRPKEHSRGRGILNPDSIRDLKNYLHQVPESQKNLWTLTTQEGLNFWLKALVRESGLKENGTIRFHLIRKYLFDIAESQIGLYEAKLLVGKRIPMSDETYLHGIEDRLLEKYKRLAYPLLRLNGSENGNGNKLSDLSKKLEDQSKVLDFLQSDNSSLRVRMQTLEDKVLSAVSDLKSIKQTLEGFLQPAKKDRK